MHNTTVCCIKDAYADVNKPKTDEKRMAERVNETRWMKIHIHALTTDGADETAEMQPLSW